MRQLDISALSPSPTLTSRSRRDESVELGTDPVEALAVAASPERKIPLVVDLDGTLVATDLLIETAFSALGRKPQSLPEALRALSIGKAALKHHFAGEVEFDPSALPYDPEVLALIERARQAGRPVFLASASNGRLVERIADHLNIFDGWFASDESINLAGEAKAARLVEEFGERGFDYVGNDKADLPVWRAAAASFAIRAPRRLTARLSRTMPNLEHLPCAQATWRNWAKMLRVHQYAKNSLVFVPLITSHLVTFGTITQALLAFVAFSLGASSVYIINDLVDLPDDRRHRSKCKRPLASGVIPLMHGLIAAPILFFAALSIAAFVSPAFVAVLLVYFAITTAYSFYLKRIMLVDVITLALLYSIRVVGGAVATDLVVSKWLLGFCLMIFISLALIKRYVELAARRDARQRDPVARDYKISDLEVVASLAAAAGFNAITIFALYISSDAGNELYSRPAILWLVGPLLLYWIARALMLASRRKMDDDPIVFALKDRVSLVTISAATALVIAAI